MERSIRCEGAAEPSMSVECRHGLSHRSSDVQQGAIKTYCCEYWHDIVATASQLASLQKTFKCRPCFRMKCRGGGLVGKKGEAILAEEAVSIGPGKDRHHCENRCKNMAHFLELLIGEEQVRDCRRTIHVSIQSRRSYNQSFGISPRHAAPSSHVPVEGLVGSAGPELSGLGNRDGGPAHCQGFGFGLCARVALPPVGQVAIYLDHDLEHHSMTFRQPS